jgi:hypothetical protein
VVASPHQTRLLSPLLFSSPLSFEPVGTGCLLDISLKYARAIIRANIRRPFSISALLMSVTVLSFLDNEQVVESVALQLFQY